MITSVGSASKSHFFNNIGPPIGRVPTRFVVMHNSLSILCDRLSQSGLGEAHEATGHHPAYRQRGGMAAYGAGPTAGDANYRHPWRRHRLVAGELGRHFCAAPKRARLDRGTKYPVQVSLGRRTRRALCRVCSGVRPPQGRRHFRYGHGRDAGSQTGHHRYSDRFPRSRRSGGYRDRRKPGAAGRQRDRAVKPCSRSRCQAAWIAAGDFAGPQSLGDPAALLPSWKCKNLLRERVRSVSIPFH